MRSMSDRVRRTILEQRLVGPSGCVVAAVSGGSDSVAMVHLLKELDGRGALRLVGLAHFNHQLRRAAADDEAFCRTLALQLGLPIDVESADVAALADRLGVSIEVAGRDARYAFLSRAAGRAGADRVAVGHTLDDQAETFLLRLLRGAGTRGMAAIRPRVGLVIRPLIDLRRDDLRAYLAAAGLAFREDESNRDLANPRNLIRHEVLPYLTRAVGSDVAPVLAREAAIARDESAYLEARAIETEPGIVVSRDADIALDLANLFIAQFGQQQGEVCMVERAPEKRKALWREMKLAPRGIDREIVDILHRTHMGDDQDPDHLLHQAMRAALGDRFGRHLPGHVRSGGAGAP